MADDTPPLSSPGEPIRLYKPEPVSAPALDAKDCQSLVLLMDASASVNSQGNWRRQYEATANALTSERVQEAIFANDGTLAVKAVSFNEGQTDITTWHSVDSPQALTRFARMLQEGGEHYWGFSSTHIGDAVQYSMEQFNSSPCQSSSRTIDISTDGENNGGIYPQHVREWATEAGVQVNGIAVGSTTVSTETAMAQLKIRAANGFVLPAGQENYEEILRRKMVMELAEAPLSPVSPAATPPVEEVRAVSGAGRSPS